MIQAAENLRMANPNEKHTENVPGQFYVDMNCIICDQCFDQAPDIFAPTEDHDHAYVHRQPKTEGEIETAIEAMEGCPVEAIGME